MDQTFDEIGEHMLELQTDTPAPTDKHRSNYKPESTNINTVRAREHRERIKAKMAIAEGKLTPEQQTPLEFLLSVMNDPSQPARRRDKCAIAAAPYIHPRVVTDNAKLGIKERRQIAAEEALRNGKFASADPPLAVRITDRTKH